MTAIADIRYERRDATYRSQRIIHAAEDHPGPPDSAFALNEGAGTADETFLAVPGGHLGAVIGWRAENVLWTRLVDWLSMRSGHEPEIHHVE